MKTVLITGCSSGFGVEIARHFLDQGWKVIATMRTPRTDGLPQSPNLRVLQLDVTDAQSIERAVHEAGPIDVLVNNAGIGLLSVFEATPVQAYRDIFETNTIGLMALTRAVLPQFRQRKAGVIVNVASTVTLKALPLLPVYTASKAAVVAFTESLALELQPLNIRASVVLPGLAPDTQFGANAMPRLNQDVPEEYAPILANVLAGFQNYSGPITRASQVAEAVWRSATDASTPWRIPAGDDAVEHFAAQAK
ncbi:SDR family oxidoreductase [Bordetella genomosp. 13]|uniref:SDR family oxidoreductase n=1 Tax=Bordetella genomosp. 13 TaxID=463040 RepID=UPI00119F7FA0|nr:SDR family oxidoreductase [Bordetella genomosp. 13]